jgi:uncharacterized protein (TIGR02646 family)
MGDGRVKRVLKGVEPPALTTYRDANPRAKWQEMQNDLADNGQQACLDCREQAIINQKGLCAFCEIDIHDNLSLRCRVEHFHPKSDTSTKHNWALDWQNMLGVCSGGSQPGITDSSFYMPPTRENLSCDAHKDRMIQSGMLPKESEGWILNPLQLTASPSLFRIKKGSGEIEPDSSACQDCEPWPDNRHENLETLVQHSIDMFNLNCDRLIQTRLKIIHNIEHNKKQQRQKGFNAQQGLNNLAQHYFCKEWRGFFTTIRFCLKPAAEAYLTKIGFQG